MSIKTSFQVSHPLKTAVLFIVFNRLETTKLVFEEIRKARPPRLYIAGDGARKEKLDEEAKVYAIREYIISSIDWDCQINTLFRENNIGCGPNVKKSIDWFFEHEECGIILEDDCKPVQSFFWFCEDLLNKYSHENRIGMIAGTNHFTDFYKAQESYIFSKYKDCWGWASWRRSWVNMDYDMSWRLSDQSESIIANMGVSDISVLHWKEIIKLIEDRKVSAWDWQWYFSIASQNQLCIFPKVNLISNLGFGDDATHTKKIPKRQVTKVQELDLHFIHPEYICSSIKFDTVFEKYKIRKTFLRRLFFKLPPKFRLLIKSVLRKN